MLEEYDIANRLLGVTADNASNNSKMMEYMELYYSENYPDTGFSVAWNQVECMSHVFNLGAQQLLKEFKQPVEKDNYEASSDSSEDMVSAISRLAFLCRKIRLSPKLRRLMEKICKEKGVQYLVPIIDVITRWNSTFDMLVRAKVIREVISDTMYQNKDNQTIKLILTEDDWNCVTQLIEVLEPLKEATLLASCNGESLMVINMFLHNMIPLYHYCTTKLQGSFTSFNRDDDIYVGIKAAVEKLNHYYDKISPMAGIALILDPTRKQQYLTNSLKWKKPWVDSVIGHFKSSFEYYRSKKGDANPVQISIGTSMGGFGEFEKKQRLMECNTDLKSMFDTSMPL